MKSYRNAPQLQPPVILMGCSGSAMSSVSGCSKYMKDNMLERTCGMHYSHELPVNRYTPHWSARFIPGLPDCGR